MKVDTYACDGCGVKRVNDSNHWYLVTVVGPLIITPWSQAKVEDIVQAYLHLCGRTCLLKKVNELLDKL